MKKLLAILLAMVLTFSCVSLLGTGVAMAEEQQAGDVLVNSDFSKDNAESKWNYRGNVQYLQDEDGSYFARVSGSADTVSQLYSSTVKLIPGNTYKLTFKLRIDDTSGQFWVKNTNDDGSEADTYKYQYAPEIAIGTTPNAKGGEQYPTAYGTYYEGDKDYAHTYNKRRGGFVGNWFYGSQGTSAKATIRQKYSAFSYNEMVKTLGYSTTSPNAAYNDKFVDMTYVFQAVADDLDTKAHTFVFHMKKGANTVGLSFDVKDVQLTCTKTMPEGVILQDDFETRNATKWQGANLTYVDTDGDSVTDSVQLGGSSYRTFSSAFALNPGSKYNLTFDMKIPETSVDFGKLFPKFVVYQPSGTELYGKVQSVYSEGKNDYAYSYDNSATETDSTKWTKLRRQSFSATVKYGDKTTTIDGYSSFGDNQYKALFKDEAGNRMSPNTVFADWVTVSFSFTALEEVEGEGNQLVALYVGLSEVTGTQLYLKNIKLYEEKAHYEAEPEITDNMLFYEGFEETETDPAALVNVYGYGNGLPVSWSKPSITRFDAGNGYGYYSALAMSQTISIPFSNDYGALELEKYLQYQFSLKWKLNVTEAEKSQLSQVLLVGYNDDDLALVGTKGEDDKYIPFESVYKVITTVVHDNPLDATGEWESIKFRTILKEADETFENYAIVVKYKAPSGDSNRIYLDTVVVEEVELIGGDYNGTDVANTEDTVLLAKYFAGWASDLDDYLADFDGDTVANLYDLVAHAQHVAGWGQAAEEVA